MQDDRNPENVLLHFIQMKHIGKVSFDESLSPIKSESTPVGNCVDNIQSLLKSYHDRTERIIVQASSDSLVQIPEFRHFFSPIDQILSSILEKDRVGVHDLLKYRTTKSRTKIKQYLKLLESMQIIEFNDSAVQTSEMYWLIRNRLTEKNQFDEESFRKAIISELLRIKYTALTQVFEISRLQPSIHIDSCIYRPAMEAEELICLSTKSVSEYYRSTYGRINDYKVINYLRRLNSVEAIERKGKLWCGKEILLEKMIDLKKDMPELAPPLL